VNGIIHELTDETFDQELAAGAGHLWLVDFWAAWCPPCLALHPILEELAPEVNPEVAIGRVDTSANPDVAERFAVQTLPTLLIISNGAVAKRLLGAKTKRQLLFALSEVGERLASCAEHVETA
jgi:thioredoxin 1